MCVNFVQSNVAMLRYHKTGYLWCWWRSFPAAVGKVAAAFAVVAVVQLTHGSPADVSAAGHWCCRLK